MTWFQIFWICHSAFVLSAKSAAGDESAMLALHLFSLGNNVATSTILPHFPSHVLAFKQSRQLNVPSEPSN